MNDGVTERSRAAVGAVHEKSAGSATFSFRLGRRTLRAGPLCLPVVDFVSGPLPEPQADTERQHDTADTLQVDVRWQCCDCL